MNDDRTYSNAYFLGGTVDIIVVNHAPEPSISIQPGEDQLIIVERDIDGEVIVTIQDRDKQEQKIVLGKV